jgi:hypothetical protein
MRIQAKAKYPILNIFDEFESQFLNITWIIFLRRKELVAWIFELYINYKLQELNIQNITPTELKMVLLLFDKLLLQIRKYF